MKKLGYFVLALKLIIMVLFSYRAIAADWTKDIYKKLKGIE